MKNTIKILAFVMVLVIAISIDSNAKSLIPGLFTKTKVTTQKVKRTKETNFYARRFGRFHNGQFIR